MKRIALIVVVALQALFLLASAAVNEYRLGFGRTILLQAHRADPRDLLRGDFLILGYGISELDPALADQPISSFTAGTPVYVVLAKHGEFLEAIRASKTPPQRKPGEVVIRGVCRGGGQTQTLSIDYGLERYYVREGTGNPVGALTVEVSVGPSGVPMIREVYLDGVPYAKAMRSR